MIDPIDCEHAIMLRTIDIPDWPESLPSLEGGFSASYPIVKPPTMATISIWSEAGEALYLQQPTYRVMPRYRVPRRSVLHIFIRDYLP